MELHRPLPEAAASAVLIFNAIVIPDYTADDWTLDRRLTAIAAVLNSQEAKGRASVTQSQVNSYIIGLRKYGDDPQAAVMLERLDDTRGKALDWRTLSRRTSGG